MFFLQMWEHRPIQTSFFQPHLKNLSTKKESGKRVPITFHCHSSGWKLREEGIVRLDGSGAHFIVRPNILKCIELHKNTTQLHTSRWYATILNFSKCFFAADHSEESHSFSDSVNLMLLRNCHNSFSAMISVCNFRGVHFKIKLHTSWLVYVAKIFQPKF